MTNVTRLPGPIADVWDWQLEGNCRGMDSAFFFHPEGEWQIHRVDQVMSRIVPELFLAQNYSLAALSNKAEGGLVHGTHRFRRFRGTTEEKARECLA